MEKLVLTCPWVWERRDAGRRASGSVACPASSTSTWEKWPTGSPREWRKPAVMHVLTTTLHLVERDRELF